MASGDVGDGGGGVGVAGTGETVRRCLGVAHCNGIEDGRRVPECVNA
jgi:hypothetical protein